MNKYLILILSVIVIMLSYILIFKPAGVISPVPEEEGIKVIILTPTPGGK